MPPGASVDVDTSSLKKGLTRMGVGLGAAARAVTEAFAEHTAGEIRSAVPVRSGRLRSTVGTQFLTDGYGVTYGGTLPYAAYIEHRSHAVEDATDGLEDRFLHAAVTAAAKVIGGQ